MREAGHTQGRDNIVQRSEAQKRVPNTFKRGLAAAVVGLTSLYSPAYAQTEVASVPTESTRVNLCGQIDSLPSKGGVANTELNFINLWGSPIRLFWKSFDGTLNQSGAPVMPGNSARKPTVPEQLWVVADAEGNCVDALYPEPQPLTVAISRPELEVSQEEEAVVSADQSETPASQSENELLPTFPKEIELGANGSVLHNMGTTWGIAPRKDFSPDVASTSIRGPEAEAANLQYVRDMFAKYGNKPDRGKGKKLEIFFYDNSADDPFVEQSKFVGSPHDAAYYRFAREADGIIEFHIALGEDWRYSSRSLLLILSAINQFTIIPFLEGNHDFIIQQNPSLRKFELAQSADKDLHPIDAPAKLFLYRAEGK